MKINIGDRVKFATISLPNVGYNIDALAYFKKDTHKIVEFHYTSNSYDFYCSYKNTRYAFHNEDISDVYTKDKCPEYFL